jgi:predicted ester cyclase
MNTKDFAEKLIKAWYEAFHEGKFDMLEKLDDPKIVYHLMALNQEIVGFEADKQYIIGMCQAAPGARIELKYLTGEGNLFALEFKTSGSKFTGNVTGFPPPTGKEITAHTLIVFRLKNGKVAEVWSNGTITGLT